MAILIDEIKRVLVQGITGREGRARTRLMREYGTNVVGGVTPGKGGQTVLGVPVFNTPQDAVDSLGNIDISVLFVPAAGVKEAAISAIDAGIKLTVLVPDRVPLWDAMEIAAAAKANGAMFLGPNTLGALSPGKAVVGMIGGRAESARQWFKPGVPKGIGVISRSGGMASSTGYYLGQAGVRLSTILHIGGDGNSPLKIKCTAAPKETRPMRSAMSYPRTATRLGSTRVTAVFQTAFLSVSLIRLCPFIRLRISTTALGSSPNASTTVAPASRNAFTLPACVPRPPSMIAPA